MTTTSRGKVDLGKLTQAYRRGLECDSTYMTTVAGFVGGKPLCRTYTTARSLSTPAVGMACWVIDWVKLTAASTVVLIVALASRSKRRPPAGGIYVYQQDRLQRLMEFLDPDVVPVQFTMNVLRFVRNRTVSKAFTNRISPWKVPVLAVLAALIQIRFWLGFLRRPDWRLVAYGIPSWGRAIEFLCLREVVLSAGPGGPVWSTAIIDRTISWLSELRRLEGFFLGSIQHGSYEGVFMPHRLQIDRLICYPWSETFFRDHFGEPLSVTHEPDLLRLQTKFVMLSESRPEITGIAVISQPCLTSRTVEILESLAEHLRSSREASSKSGVIRLLVYAHPLEDPSVFDAVVAKYPDLVELSAKERHADIVLAIAQYSTLALEYARLGVPTLVYPPGTFEADFFGLPGITVVRNDSLLHDAFDRAVFGFDTFDTSAPNAISSSALSTSDERP